MDKNKELPFVYYSIEEYINEAFADNSKPDPRAVRSWINAGALAGQRYGKAYYVKIYKKAIRNES